MYEKLCQEILDAFNDQVNIGCRVSTAKLGPCNDCFLFFSPRERSFRKNEIFTNLPKAIERLRILDGGEFSFTLWNLVKFGGDV